MYARRTTLRKQRIVYVTQQCFEILWFILAGTLVLLMILYWNNYYLGGLLFLVVLICVLCIKKVHQRYEVSRLSSSSSSSLIHGYQNENENENENRNGNQNNEMTSLTIETEELLSSGGGDPLRAIVIEESKTTVPMSVVVDTHSSLTAPLLKNLDTNLTTATLIVNANAANETKSTHLNPIVTAPLPLLTVNTNNTEPLPSLILDVDHTLLESLVFQANNSEKKQLFDEVYNANADHKNKSIVDVTFDKQNKNPIKINWKAGQSFGDERLIYRLKLDHRLFFDGIIKTSSPEDSLESCVVVAIKFRPGIFTFVEQCMNVFLVDVYTMGIRAYAIIVVALIEYMLNNNNNNNNNNSPKKNLFFRRIVSRENHPDNETSSKYLFKEFWRHDDCLVIDDNANNVWSNYMNHLIQIKRYAFWNDKLTTIADHVDAVHETTKKKFLYNVGTMTDVGDLNELNNLYLLSDKNKKTKKNEEKEVAQNASIIINENFGQILCTLYSVLKFRKNIKEQQCKLINNVNHSSPSEFMNNVNHSSSSSSELINNVNHSSSSSSESIPTDHKHENKQPCDLSVVLHTYKQMTKARWYFENEQWSSCLINLKCICQIFYKQLCIPIPTQCWIMGSIASKKIRKWKSSKKWHTRWIASEANCPTAHCSRAEVHFQLQDYLLALRDCNVALQSIPEGEEFAYFDIQFVLMIRARIFEALRWDTLGQADRSIIQEIRMMKKIDKNKIQYI
jgi:hypothetical protein